MTFKPLALRLCLSVVTILVCLAALEAALRGYHAIQKGFDTAHADPSTGPGRAVPPPRSRQTGLPTGPGQAVSPPHSSQAHPPPLHIVVSAPTLYELNPEHPEISSQGLRDDVVSIPKPEGTLRILVLGDSIAYGKAVSRDKTFPNLLEHLLVTSIGSAEVINAGVQGYTAYNELQYYLTRGREFEADIVIVAFCMNDVVNPRLHWGKSKETIVHVPDEAIPNHDYDQHHVLPRMQKMKSEMPTPPKAKETSLLEHLEIYNAAEERVARLFQKNTRGTPRFNAKIPTYITGEDTLSIEVLLDDDSPEWQWLTSMYDQLHEAVQADHATLVIAIFPLAYQIDEDYPYLPQHHIAEYCRQNSILSVDLLGSFRQHRKEDVFLLKQSRYYDIWHLTEYGHELSAEVIYHFLQENRLLLHSP